MNRTPGPSGRFCLLVSLVLIAGACAPAPTRSEHDELPYTYHFPGPRRALQQPDTVVEDAANGTVSGPGAGKPKQTPRPGLR